MRLTKSNIGTLAITNGKAEQIYFDDEIVGFGLRVRKTGGRTLIFQYGRRGPGNKTPKLKIGTVGAIDFAEARKVAKTYYARVQLGEDPARDKSDAKVKSAETFAAFLPRFLAHQRERLRPRTYPDLERHLLVHAKALHDLPLAKVTRRDVAAVIGTVAGNAGDPTSNRVRTSLSSFFSWCMGEGLLDANPVIGTNKREEKKRDRVLAPAELRLIWTHAGEDHYGAILRLLMLTGARANEIASLRWDEVHGNMIVLPARAIIEAQPRRIGTDGSPRDLIFGTGEGPFSGWSNCKASLTARIVKATGAPLPPWTPHDLRRSFSTHANELGIAQPHIIEACLGHVSGFRSGVSGVYNLARYRSEARAALDRWADQLLAWIEGRESSVAMLRRG
jgi:integrase